MQQQTLDHATRDHHDAENDECNRADTVFPGAHGLRLRTSLHARSTTTHTVAATTSGSQPPSPGAQLAQASIGIMASSPCFPRTQPSRAPPRAPRRGTSRHRPRRLPPSSRSSPARPSPTRMTPVPPGHGAGTIGVRSSRGRSRRRSLTKRRRPPEGATRAPAWRRGRRPGAGRRSSQE